MRIQLTEEKVLSTHDAIEILFPNKKTQEAARLFTKWLNENGGRATKNQVSRFADVLQEGKLRLGNTPVKYSRRNFYLTVLRSLINMGFLQRNVPVWDEKSRRTLYVYTRNIFDIPKKPPSIGFWRIAYYVCRKWNRLFET
jgi:hypothetical protein